MVRVACDRARDMYVIIIIGDGPHYPCDTCVICHTIGSKGKLLSTGWVHMEGWQLVETGKGGMGVWG